MKKLEKPIHHPLDLFCQGLALTRRSNVHYSNGGNSVFTLLNRGLWGLQPFHPFPTFWSSFFTLCWQMFTFTGLLQDGVTSPCHACHASRKEIVRLDLCLFLRCLRWPFYLLSTFGRSGRNLETSSLRAFFRNQVRTFCYPITVQKRSGF